MQARALVVMAFLVAVPAYAMYGGSLPDVARIVLAQLSAAGAERPCEPQTDAPQFRPTEVAGPPSHELLVTTAEVEQLEPEPVVTPASFASRQADEAQSRVTPVAYQPNEQELLQLAQRRLAELGATSCRLDPWGSEGQRFRFQCKVALRGNPGWARHFEAVSSNPTQAVDQVMQDVESWLTIQ